MWHVYILHCNDGSLYTGITNDLKKRVDRHNGGDGAKYTRTRRPVKLVHSESFSSKGKALTRELEIKDFNRENKERLIKFGPDFKNFR